MNARLGDIVLAEATDDELIRIEGNWYFPQAALNAALFTESPTQYHCAWKGDARYFSVVVDGVTHADQAWSYPTPPASAIERVGKDFAGYVAFGGDVEVGP